jgi:hypothetical protein
MVIDLALQSQDFWPIGGAAVAEIDARLLPVMLAGECPVSSEHFEQLNVGSRPAPDRQSNKLKSVRECPPRSFWHSQRPAASGENERRLRLFLGFL